jgi:D-alanine-D-alanine ligase
MSKKPTWGQDSPGLNIGLTYDLREVYLAEGYSEEETAEFDRVETVDCLATALEGLGHTTDRIGHARELMSRLVRGDRWDLVFNICEGLKGISREAQVPAILDVYGIPYTFSDPLVMALTLDKGMTKTVLRGHGVPTADYAAIRRVEDLKGLKLTYPLFAKPIAEGTGKGIDPGSIVNNPKALEVRCKYLLERFHQPVLVESYLPGREFTVGLWGTGPEAQAIGTLEIVLRATAEPNVYSYANKENCEELVDYVPVWAQKDPLVKRCEEIALDAWRALDCRDAGRIDLRCDSKGQPLFMEVNPLAGLHPHHSDLPMICTACSIPYEDLIHRIVESARTRVVANAKVMPA